MPSPHSINKLLYTLICFFVLSTQLNAQTEAQQEFIEALELTVEEKEWLEKNYIVRVHPDIWPPFNYWDNASGNNMGISVEYIRWIERSTGINFEYPSMYSSLKHALEALENKQLDITPSIQKATEREDYLIFCDPIYTAEFALFSMNNEQAEGNIFEIEGVRITSEDASTTYNYIADNYPNVTLIPVLTEEDGLRKLTNNETDYHAGSSEVCYYLIDHNYGLGEIELQQTIDGFNAKVYIAVRKDWPELASIINKTLAAMPKDVQSDIVDSYLNRIDWKLIIDILFGILILVTIVLIIFITLLKKSLKKQKKQKDTLVQNDFQIQKALEITNLHFLEFEANNKVLYLPPQSAFLLTGNKANNYLKYREALKYVLPEDIGIIKKVIRTIEQKDNHRVKFNVVDHKGNLISVNCIITKLKELGAKGAKWLLSCHDVTKEVEFSRYLLTTQQLAQIGHFNFDFTSQQFQLSSEAENILGLSKPNSPYSAEYLVEHLKIENYSNIRSQFRRAIKQKSKLYKTTIAIKTKNSIKHLNFINKFSYSNDNLVLAHNGYIQDITELKETDLLLTEAKREADRANKAKSLFLARMSHEIRTPLSVIAGMLDLSLQTELSEKQKNYLTKSKMASKHLGQIINEILEFSKIESGKAELTPHNFNFHACISEVKEMMAVKAAKKQLELSVELEDATIPQFVYGDEMRLKQVFINLLSNAINYTGRGYVYVSIKDDTNAHTFNKKETLSIKFEIEDTGIGIPEEKIDQIFDSFVQVNESLKDKQGTGLGLAISKKTTELWGGTIGVRSVHKKGSTFYFNFICDKTDVKTIEATKSTESQPLVLQNSPNILLAEDNLLIQEIAYEHLTHLGAKVHLVNNGVEAFQAIFSGSFDLVFMDINMPVADGLTATRIIRQKLNTKLPIIAITAHALEDNKQQCLDAGMNDFVAKPFNIHDLYRVFAKWIPQYCTFIKDDNTKAKAPSKTSEETSELFNGEAERSEVVKYFGNDSERYKNYVTSFAAGNEEKLEQLKRLEADKNIQEVKDIAHNIKGEAGYLGFVKLFEACNVIHRDINDENYAQLLSELQCNLVDINHTVKNHINKVKLDKD